MYIRVELWFQYYYALKRGVSKIKKIQYKKYFTVFSALTLTSGLLVSCGSKTKTTIIPTTLIRPSIGAWVIFKDKITANSATDLKDSLTTYQLSDYLWTNNPVAQFWYNHHWQIDDNNFTITTYISIKGAQAAVQHPIKFEISYQDSQWTTTYYGDIARKSWNDFRIKLVQASRDPDVLSQFAIANGHATNWTADTDHAEWDTYGGHGEDDPYKGMGGSLVINDNIHSAQGIISIKGARATFGAHPLIVNIVQNQDQVYDISDWSFTPTDQMQSRILFADSCQTLINNNEKFLNNNNLKQQIIDNKDGDSKKAFDVGKVTKQYNKTGNQYQVLVEIGYTAKRGHLHATVTVHNDLKLKNDDGNYGPAYQDKNWIF